MTYREINEAWIVGAVRTPIGRHGGSLSSVRPDDLGALVLEALVERTGVPPEEVEDVYMGCANQAGEDNRNVARMSLLLAAFPEDIAGATVNRLCGSGLEAVASAARAVMLGEAPAYIGGGVESMSRAPWAAPKPERAFPTGHLKIYDTTLGWRFVNPKMEAMGHTDTLGVILLSDTLGVSMLIVGLNNKKPPGATQATVFGPFFVEGSPLFENGRRSRQRRPRRAVFRKGPGALPERGAHTGRAPRSLAGGRRRILRRAVRGPLRGAWSRPAARR